MRSDADIVADLRSTIGAAYVIDDEADAAPYLEDWRKRYRGEAVAIVKPGTVEDVQAVARLCSAWSIAMVPQGGNTGMCGGATPSTRERSVVIRLDRLNRIREVSPHNNSIVAEAGCILADLQRAALSVDRLFPLSLGGEGTCQIGGNISTNAGGINVLRYGPTRDLVMGLEIVLADGTLLDCLRKLRKDNTGYDLKHLFVGAEGTLGIVTAASLKILPNPKSTGLGLAAVPDVARALDLLNLFRGQGDHLLSSFEIISRNQVEIVLEHIPGTRFPLPTSSPWFCLVELKDEGVVDLGSVLEATMATAMERGIVLDAVIAQNASQEANIWRVRHDVSEANNRAGVSISHDTAVPLDTQQHLVDRVVDRIEAAYPAANVLMVGHIGDGNIHIIGHFPHGHFADRQAFDEAARVINGIVDDVTLDLGGSVSAEHGIGITNRARLLRDRGPVQLAYMRQIKQVFDPLGLMNPGKLFL